MANLKHTHQRTAHIPVITLWTKDVEIFLHFHAFLQADSGMGSLLNPVLTSLKKPTEPPVVKITELNSMTEPSPRLEGFKDYKCPQVSGCCLMRPGGVWTMNDDDDGENQVNIPIFTLLVHVNYHSNKLPSKRRVFTLFSTKREAWTRLSNDFSLTLTRTFFPFINPQKTGSHFRSYKRKT